MQLRKGGVKKKAAAKAYYRLKVAYESHENERKRYSFQEALLCAPLHTHRHRQIEI